MKKLEEVAAKFDSLGIKSFGADLPAGKIHWVNAQGEIVARGDCKAVISFAGTNNSYIWLSTMAQYESVPTLPIPEGSAPYVEPATETEARAAATLAAIGDKADYLYAAPVGGGGYVYLAVYNLRFEEQPSQEPVNSSQVGHVWEYIATTTDMLMELHGTPKFTASYRAFMENLHTFAGQTMGDLPAADVMRQLATDLETADQNYQGGYGLRTALFNARARAKEERRKLG